MENSPDQFIKSLEDLKRSIKQVMVEEFLLDENLDWYQCRSKMINQLDQQMIQVLHTVKSIKGD